MNVLNCAWLLLLLTFTRIDQPHCEAFSFVCPTRPLQRQYIHNRNHHSEATRQRPKLFNSSPRGDDDMVITDNIISAQKKTVSRLEKFARLPVWPAWNGALIWLTGRLLGNTVASQLEDKITGRVCPNFFENNAETSPFLLLVHHCHSFAIGDVGRYIQQALILPEGFPSHPHRGFNTLTYFMSGGFRHRDSMGIEQHYGVKPDKSVDYPHSQWLRTGAGVLHEEMFDSAPPPPAEETGATEAIQTYPWTSREFWWQRHELYQIWVNVPANEKMDPPSVVLLSDAQDTPVVTEANGGIQVRVLAGNYRQKYKATTPITTDMLILHVTLNPGQRWTCPFPPGFETCFLYLRKGSLLCPGMAADDETTHHTAYFTAAGDSLELRAAPSSSTAADFMLLAAVPIREPCVTRGSMVMNTQSGIDRAYADYQAGFFGQPWDHKLTREEWKEHVRRYPSQFR